MINQDTYIRVPAHLLARIADRLQEIDAINANLITGNINQKVQEAQHAVIEACGKHIAQVFPHKEAADAIN